MPGHLCGKVLDLARHCCLSGMKLWADSDEITPGYWFRTEPGAEVIQGQSPFRKHSTWDREIQWDGTGEQTTTRPGYYKGQNPLGYDGKRHCGGDEWIRTGGIHGRDEPLTTDSEGALECCFPPGANPLYLTCQRTINLGGDQQGNSTWPAGLPPTCAVIMALWRLSTSAPAPLDSFPGWTMLETRLFDGGFQRLTVLTRPAGGATPESISVASTFTNPAIFTLFFYQLPPAIDVWADSVLIGPGLLEWPRITPTGPNRTILYLLHTNRALESGPVVFPPMATGCATTAQFGFADAFSWRSDQTDPEQTGAFFVTLFDDGGARGIATTIALVA